MADQDLGEQFEDGIAILTLSRPPHNFFDAGLIGRLADAVERCDRMSTVRAIVLRSDQKSFCAGADFGGGKQLDAAALYRQAARIAARRKPMVAAVKGAAIGGGFGVAMAADMRVGCAEARLQANFTRIGISPGFGLSFTLPRIAGQQVALDLLLTARRVQGEEARQLGLLDRLVAADEVDVQARDLALTLAANSPAALVATRALLLDDYAARFAAAVTRELECQTALFALPDFPEGVQAAAERRPPRFADV